MNKGMAARWLSILSKTPPWPGIRFDESLTPATLLNRLAAASPRTENRLVIKNIMNKLKVGRLVIKLNKIVKTIGTVPIAIKNPSKVLLGLIFLRNFLFPNFLPPK